MTPGPQRGRRAAVGVYDRPARRRLGAPLWRWAVAVIGAGVAIVSTVMFWPGR